MLDIHTLSLVAMISMVTASFATLMVWHLIPQERSLRDWAVGITLLTAGFFILSLRGIIPNFFTVVIANTILILSVGYLHLGTRKLLGFGFGRPWHWYAAAITFLNCIVTVYIVPSHALRAIALSVLYVPLFFSCAWMFWNSREPQLKFTERFTAFIFALGALLFLIHGLTPPQDKLAVPNLHDAQHWFFAIIFIYVILFSTWVGVMLTLIVNVRRQQQLVEALDQAEKSNQIAEQALADQRQFIAMVSHEFRSPLSVIDVSAQLLIRKLGETSESVPVIARIRRGVARLTAFVDNCLTQERFANETFVLHAARVNLKELAAWATADLASSDRIIVTEMDPDLSEVEGDMQLLRILLSNLLSNAVKYSPADSIITLRFMRQETTLHLEVIDRGQGISADELPLIFKKYVRGSATGDIPGAGLGLTLAARIIELHGGSIDVHSQPGKGCLFIVKIPLTSCR